MDADERIFSLIADECLKSRRPAICVYLRASAVPVIFLASGWTACPMHLCPAGPRASLRSLLRCLRPAPLSGCDAPHSLRRARSVE